MSDRFRGLDEADRIHRTRIGARRLAHPGDGGLACLEPPLS
jgi:hypothetical protein